MHGSRWVRAGVAFGLSMAGPLGAQVATEVRGEVRTSAGIGVAHANVFVLETLEGVLSDEAGRFRLQTNRRGPATLVVLAEGFREERLTLVLPVVEPVRIVLQESPILLPGLRATAGAFVAADAPDVSLTPLQVVTTPGAQADIYRAIQTFPGLQHVDEGAGLFVRGGDVTETKVLLNGGRVLSPYRYESPTGGFFGAFDPFLLDGIFFSSGGFGARHGDALSGVAALETLGRPPKASGAATLSLAAMSATAALPVGAALGVRGTLTRSNTRLMFDVNGTTSEFTRVPEGRDASASATWRYGRAGEVEVFALDRWNQLGVVVEETSYSGAYEADERHELVVVSWNDLIGRMRPSAGVSTSGSRRQRSFGAFRLDMDERYDEVRAHAEIGMGAHATLTVGGELERRRSTVAGSVPEQDYDNRPGARRRLFESEVTGTRHGAFAELDWQPGERLRLIGGLRSDRSDLNDERSWDPRLSAAFQLSEAAVLTAAWGLYHQTAGPLFYEGTIGGRSVPPMRAEHRVLGVQLGADDVSLRIEAYDKRYRDLALRTRGYDVVTAGTGSSRGVDVFARPPAFLGLRTRMSLSLIRARRTDPDAGIVARSPYDISRGSTVVVERDFGPSWKTSLAWRSASGQPFTGVVGAVRDTTQDVWVPAYGPPMGERLPAFRRMDLSASRLLSVFGSDLTVLFVGVTNVFDRDNVHSYRYSRDYTKRLPVRSQFKRSIYFGASISF